MDSLTIYTTSWCPDCVRAKHFLKRRGVRYREINIEDDESAEELVLRVNHGKRKVPTLELGGRYFACSPFDAAKLASELKLPLNS